MDRPSHDKVIIGVSGHSPHTKSVRAIMKQLASIDSTVVFLSSYTLNVKADVTRDMEWIDALVVMGNDWDIDPKSYIDRYPEDDPKRCTHPKTKNEQDMPHGKVRARYEEAMLEQALKRGMPVLGICGGMHRINVLCGGTLHQHIPELVGCDKHMQHKQGIAPHIPVLPIVIKNGTTLAGIAGCISMPFVKKNESGCPKVIMENSMHHQAVDIVAPDLRVCAVTDTIRLPDGTAGFMAQAIEADPDGKYGRQFILGVQWHPEYGASTLGEHIIRYFMEATHKFSKKRQKHIVFRKVRTIHGFSG